MARDALGKLSEADELDKIATRITKRDPVSARKMQNLARTKRGQAIRQMQRRPKRTAQSTLKPR